jgi:hypothetical protein
MLILMVVLVFLGGSVVLMIESLKILECEDLFMGLRLLPERRVYGFAQSLIYIYV